MKYKVVYLSEYGEPCTKPVIIEEDALDEARFNGYTIIERIAETVVEEDELAGHPYPGHECWED
jgi:hypothetical protein